jgi:hypothetical protein
MKKIKIRLLAIFNCIYFGILPSWVYEKVKHYDCSYIQHLVINLRYAWRWITFTEDQSDWEFELNTNKNSKK